MINGRPESLESQHSRWFGKPYCRYNGYSRCTAARVGSQHLCPAGPAYRQYLVVKSLIMRYHTLELFFH